MFRWFLYDDSSSGNDDTDEIEEKKETERRGRGRQASDADSASDTGAAPTFDKMDPAVTAAILTQASFRGYRLRERLRRLPAREAEKTIRGLQRNARGFERLGLFLTFFGLYFGIVFMAVDVSFQRSVEQGLRGHLAKVKYGPQADRSHEDVSSLADLHQWMRAFFLQTYHGTQVEHPCMACIVKPPDEVCDACDFTQYDERNYTLPGWSFNVSSSHSSTSGTGGFSSSGSSVDLSEECGRCVIGRYCTADYLEACLAAVDAASDEASGDSSTSPPASEANSSAAATALNLSALAGVDVEPVGGVSIAGGYLTVDNLTDCEAYSNSIGLTENMGRFQVNLAVAYNGIGYVANRNRIIGGMLVTFTRRLRLSEEECESSRDYYDVCLSDKEDKETIVPGEIWSDFRPEEDIEYNSEAEGFPILIDTGGFNIGLNVGYCTLLAMEGLDVIPPDEVKSVSVQLVTYNGNEKTAYGSTTIGFTFEDGGVVTSKETIAIYILKGGETPKIARVQWIAAMLFIVIFLGMVRHDVRKWWRVKRSKAKLNRCHCFCGFIFFLLILINILMWVMFAALGSTVEFATGFQEGGQDGPALDSIVEELVILYSIGLFAAAYYFIFLITTLAGLYRWIFQMLTFHKRMSIVTDTLARASTHLDHFLVVFVLVILVFTNLTWLMVGSSAIEFSSLDEAWQSVIRVSLGESENFYPQILAAQPTFGPIVIVFYQVLGLVLLLNVVIAVLLEAYRGVVGGMQGEDTILQSLLAFVGMTLCSIQIRIRWAFSFIGWRLSSRRRSMERRPSLKVALQRSTGVCGVDGRPVLMVRRPAESSLLHSERQLSFNCPRYISVTEMQALIEAAPVPAFVADRLVRKVVHDWLFISDEKLPSELSSGSSGGNGISSGSGSTDSLPLLRKRHPYQPTLSP